MNCTKTINTLHKKVHFVVGLFFSCKTGQVVCTKICSNVLFSKAVGAQLMSCYHLIIQECNNLIPLKV